MTPRFSPVVWSARALEVLEDTTVLISSFSVFLFPLFPKSLPYFVFLHELLNYLGT